MRCTDRAQLLADCGEFPEGDWFRFSSAQMTSTCLVLPMRPTQCGKWKLMNVYSFKYAMSANAYDDYWRNDKHAFVELAYVRIGG